MNGSTSMEVIELVKRAELVKCRIARRKYPQQCSEFFDVVEHVIQTSPYTTYAEAMASVTSESKAAKEREQQNKYLNSYR